MILVIDTIERPLISSLIDMSLDPETVWVLSNRPTDRFGCFHDETKGNHGLASFDSEERALAFSKWVTQIAVTAERVGFAEAMEIAATRPRPVNCLMYFDEHDPHFKDPLCWPVRG